MRLRKKRPPKMMTAHFRVGSLIKLSYYSYVKVNAARSNEIFFIAYYFFYLVHYQSFLSQPVKLLLAVWLQLFIIP